MSKLSPELSESYQLAKDVKQTAFVHPILGMVDLSTAGKGLSKKLLQYGYIVEKSSKKSDKE